MEALRQALETLRARRDATREELTKLEAAVANLEALVDGRPAPPPSGARAYEGLGIADAAVRYIRESGGPRATREIADAILARGVHTASKNYTATVYAVLAASKDRLVRTPDGAWDLREKDHPLAEAV